MGRESGINSRQKASESKTPSRAPGSGRAARCRPRVEARRLGSAPAAELRKVTPAQPSWLARATSGLDRTRTLLIAGVVACATLPYLNILFNGFVHDDNTQLVKNPYVRSFHYLKEILTTNVWSFRRTSSITNYYRPMMTLGYLACYKLFGMRAYGFHLISLLLHVLVVCLVFVLAERLTRDRVAAFVASALFALHPIHTESVDWIAAVTDLELSLFYLLTFGIFVALAKPRGWRSKLMEAALAVSFVLALLSKEQAMTLPALATVYEHFYREDRRETSVSLKLSRYGVLWLVGVAYLLFRIHFFGALAPAKNLPGLTPEQILLSAIALFGQYVWKFLWPVRLCGFYVFHPNNRLFDPHVLAGVVVLLAFAALFIVCWRSRERNVRFISFAILWFFATLAPVLNAHWVASNVFTERYLYLPSVAVAWVVGVGASMLWSRAAPSPVQQGALALAGVALGGLYAARIVIRNCDWKNDVVFYSRTLDFSPDADIILNDLGTVYWDQGEADNAESAWKRSLAINPDNAPVLNNLGMVAGKRKQYDEAVKLFQRAMELRPDNPDPHLNLGRVYRVMGLAGPAESQLRQALALSPLDPRVRNELGQLLVSEGRTDAAEEQFRASLRLEPSVLAYDFLGMLDTQRYAWEAAEHDFWAALSLDEADSNAHFGLGYVYKVAGRRAEALGQYQAGLVGDPTNAQALTAVHELQ